MFLELKALLETQGSHRDKIIGKTLDCLRKIAHFRKLENSLGT